MVCTHNTINISQIHCRDKPWITPELKTLISWRQQALANGNTRQYKLLRNEVNRAVKQAKPNFFQSQVNHLKSANPGKWWKAVKNLAGYTPDKQVHSVTAGDNVLEGTSLANAVNEAFVNVHRSMPPISNSDKLPTTTSPEYYVSVKDVNDRLKAIKKSKLPGPDSIPNWLLKKFAAELAAPVAFIFNASVSQAQVPTQWKEADVWFQSQRSDPFKTSIKTSGQYLLLRPCLKF